MVQELVHPKHPTVSARWEEITPTLAAAYLERNENNRAFDSANLSKIVSDFSSDDFDDQNPAPIVFDEAGVLSNGQHRLTGIVKTGKTITMLVVRGVRPQVYLTMDSGKSRTFGNALHKAGYQNYSALSSIVRGCLAYQRGGSLKTIDRPVSNTSAMSLLLADESRFVDLAKWARSVTDPKKLGSVQLSPKRAGVFRYALEDAGARAEDVDAFFDGLAVASHAPQPITLLRAKLEQMRQKGGSKRQKVSTGYVFAICVKSWNAFIEGEEILRLGWRSGGAKPESFPVIVPFAE